MGISYATPRRWVICFTLLVALALPTSGAAETISLDADQIDSLQLFDGPIQLVCFGDGPELGRLLDESVRTGARVKLINAKKIVKKLRRKRTKVVRRCIAFGKRCQKRRKHLTARLKQVKFAQRECVLNGSGDSSSATGQSSSAGSSSLDSSSSSSSPSAPIVNYQTVATGVAAMLSAPDVMRESSAALRWRQISGDAVEISRSQGFSAVFAAPSTPGILQFELTTISGESSSRVIYQVDVVPFEPAETIYVDGSAIGSLEEGSADEPFLAIDAALRAASAGSLVLIRPGVYEERLRSMEDEYASGTATQPIVIQAENWQPGSAFDDSGDVVIKATGSRNRVLEVNEKAYWIMRGLIFEGVEISGKNAEVLNSNHFVIEDCVFREGGGMGLSLAGKQGSYGHIVRRSLFKNNGQMGLGISPKSDEITGATTDILVEDCDSTGNGWDKREDAEGFWVAAHKDAPPGLRHARITFRRLLGYKNISSNFAVLDTDEILIEDCIGWGTFKDADGQADGRNFVFGLHDRASGATMRGSVGFDTPRAAVWAQNHDQVEIYNNVIFDNGFQKPDHPDYPPQGDPTLKCGFRLDSVGGISLNNAVFDNDKDYSGTPDPTTRDMRYNSSISDYESDYNLIADGYGLREGPNSITGDPELLDKAGARELAELYATGAFSGSRAQFMEMFRGALCPSSVNSPLVDAGTLVDGYHCQYAADSPQAEENVVPCRQWYGTAPDIGVCEFVP